MEISKQAFHMEARKGFTKAQSNEHLRNWTEKAWKSAEERTRIDRSRQGLNFEIGKGGKILPLDKTKSIPDRMAEILKERGIIDPNKDLSEPRFRTIADFIITGSHDQLCRIAFGNQIIDYSYGTGEHKGDGTEMTLNSGIIRKPEIEQWAKDMYYVLADRYGEDNIVSFVVHLDESTPHCHANIVPITDGGKLSFKKVFCGVDKYEFRRRTLELHDLFAEVNKKWGLQRGTSIEKTHARYRPTEEYRRNLSDQCSGLENEIGKKTSELAELQKSIHQAEIRIKGLTTMARNLERTRQIVENELDGVRSALSDPNINANDTRQLSDRQESLQKKLDDILAKINDKKIKLEVADQQLQDLQQKLAATKIQHDVIQKQIRSGAENISQAVMDKVSSEALWNILNEFSEVFRNITPESAEHFNDTLLQDMTSRGLNIVACAALLSMNMIDQATTFAENCGGGGSDSGTGWGRKDDEDEREWIQRCLAKSRQMIRPSGQKVKR